MLKKFGPGAAEHYKRELSNQGMCCSICGRDEESYLAAFNKRMALDHDHETGCLRGVLCSPCNMSISGSRWGGAPCLSDDAEQYLSDWSEVHTLCA